jgi:hypothetical protein
MENTYSKNSSVIPEIHDLFDFWYFSATFNNISAISWRPVLAVEEAGVPEENPFCNLQSRARTHAVLVIGLYELLDPTT